MASMTEEAKTTMRSSGGTAAQAILTAEERSSNCSKAGSAKRHKSNMLPTFINFTTKVLMDGTQNFHLLIKKQDGRNEEVVCCTRKRVYLCMIYANENCLKQIYTQEEINFYYNNEDF